MLHSCNCDGMTDLNLSRLTHLMLLVRPTTLLSPWWLRTDFFRPRFGVVNIKFWINWSQVEGPTFGRNCVSVGDRTFTLRWTQIFGQYKTLILLVHPCNWFYFVGISNLELLILSGGRGCHWCRSHQQRAKVKQIFTFYFYILRRGGGGRRRGILNHVGDVRKEVKSLVSTYHFWELWSGNFFFFFQHIWSEEKIEIKINDTESQF